MYQPHYTRYPTHPGSAHYFGLEPTEWSMEGLGTWLHGPSTHEMRVQKQVDEHNNAMDIKHRITAKYGETQMEQDRHLEQIQQLHLARRSAKIEMARRMEACARAIQVGQLEVHPLQEQQNVLPADN